MKLKQIAKYACGGKMPKRLYGGRVAVHKDKFQNGGPVDPSNDKNPYRTAKRRSAKGVQTAEELMALRKDIMDKVTGEYANKYPKISAAAGYLQSMFNKSMYLSGKPADHRFESDHFDLQVMEDMYNKHTSIPEEELKAFKKEFGIDFPTGIAYVSKKEPDLMAASRMLGLEKQDSTWNTYINPLGASLVRTEDLDRKVQTKANERFKKTVSDKYRQGGPIDPITGRPVEELTLSEMLAYIQLQESRRDEYKTKLNFLQNQPEEQTILDRIIPPSQHEPNFLDRVASAGEQALFGTDYIGERARRRHAENNKPKLLDMLRQMNEVAPEQVQMQRDGTNVNMPLYKKGGSIHIAKNKRGTFTAAATKHNMGVQEFARHVLGNKDKFSSKMVKKANFARNFGGRKDLGGFLQDIAPLVSVIPGAQPIGAGLGIAGQLMGRDKTQPVYALNQMKLGGDFKQYSAPSHEAGGQMIDANGNPTMNMPVAEIEKDENSHDGYVFSDYLRNPATGNTYAKDAKRIAKQTKREDDISKSSRILQLMKLKQSNEALRQQAEMYQAGVPKAELGLPYRQDNSLVPDLTIPSSVTPGILPILSQLQTIGGVKASPRSYPYPYQMTESVPTANAQPQAADNLTAPENVTSASTGLSPLNQIAAGLKGAGLAYGAYDALRGSEQEKLQLPDYTRGDEYYRGLEVDLAPALGEINMAATKAVQDTSNQAGGIGARNSRVNAILSRAGKNAAQVQLQQQQANAGIRAQLGSREDMKAQTSSNERIRQQIAQSQNDATNRLAGRKFFSDLSQVGTSLNNIQYMNDMMKNQNENQRQALEYGLAILANKYPNFKADPSFFERLRSGTLTDADKPLFDQLVQFASNQ